MKPSKTWNQWCRWTAWTSSSSAPATCPSPWAVPGQQTHPEVQAQMERGVDVIVKAGKVAGVSCPRQPGPQVPRPRRPILPRQRQQLPPDLQPRLPGEYARVGSEGRPVEGQGLFLLSGICFFQGGGDKDFTPHPTPQGRGNNEIGSGRRAKTIASLFPGLISPSPLRGRGLCIKSPEFRRI